MYIRGPSAPAAEGGDSFAPLQKAVAIPYQASKKCSQRHPVPGFEQENVFGTKLETKKIHSILILHSCFKALCPHS